MNLKCPYKFLLKSYLHTNKQLPPEFGAVPGYVSHPVAGVAPLLAVRGATKTSTEPPPKPVTVVGSRWWWPRPGAAHVVGKVNFDPVPAYHPWKLKI